MQDKLRTLWAAIDAAARDITAACRRVGRTVAVLPWPAVAVCCVALALVISVLPLALFLFILFMLVKVVVAAFVIEARRPAPTPCHDIKD